MYAVIDIETTGGNAAGEKITEIAIFLHDGVSVTEHFSTLINPERNIPPHITRLTGITNEMVRDAPKFYEVARKIVEMTEDKIFVAHNVSFDYGFIRNEFRSLGYDYKRKRLCTVKLSRSLIPGQSSYSLGVLCRSLGIPNAARHRAAGDAEATCRLLEKLVGIQNLRKGTQLASREEDQLNMFTDHHRRLLDSLPEDTGVYYFHNSANQIIYVGKSKNIRSRVISHFANANGGKAGEMKENIIDISYEVTGSELVALLKESEEIKRLKPFYNRAQRRSEFPIGVFAGYDAHGYITFSTSRIKSGSQPVSAFSTVQEAEGFLMRLCSEFELCQKLTGLYPTSGACFHYQVKKCNGACVQKEPADTYNERAEAAAAMLRYEYPNAVIIDRGRTPGECAFVCIENGRYLGFGFADPDMLQCAPEQMKEYINSCRDTRHAQQIINTWLRQAKAEKVIVY